MTQGLSIVEASVDELQTALSTGQINSVQLIAKHLIRVARYDRRGPRLNSLVVYNTDVFEHAQASDDFRAHDGAIRSPLEGLPGTLKDSYMMAGLTVASGSPAFQNLTAHKVAFTVGKLREGGAVLLGKTNMPPMANGGMQRGVYGRAESPYSKGYLTAAYASGSSNGAGSSTAASFAVFAMAEETVSSGRSPASNNGLAAYTPSRGVLSIRGNWPLFPSADVPVPYARTIEDLVSLLDVIVQDDADTTADFWRGQPWVELPAASSVRHSSYKDLLQAGALAGKRVGVPKMYIGERDDAAQPTWISPEVRSLWDNARATLESLGAIVEEVGFPLITTFETPGVAAWNTSYPLPGSINDTTLTTPFAVWAYGWDDFLRMVNDTDSGITSLSDADPTLIFPQLPNTLPDRYGGRFGNRTSSNIGIVSTIATRNNTSIFDVPGLEVHLKALEARRVKYLEEWLDTSHLDALEFPSVGDVGPEDAETNETSAELAWRNGVFFSHGNYALRRFGVPTVSTNMGLISGKQMPVDLTFAGKAYDDNALLSYAYAFEQAHGKRVAPPLTPELPTDIIEPRDGCSTIGTQPPKLLEITVNKLCGDVVELSGSIDSATSGAIESLEIFVDGVPVAPTLAADGTWSVLAKIVPYDDPIGDVPIRVVNVPDQSLAMVIVLATAGNGRSDAKLLWV